MTTATDAAQSKAQEILKDRPGMVFRIAIQGGGCNGFRYDFSLTEPEQDDIVICEGIVTDPISNVYLVDAVLDFTSDNPFAQTFTLSNPQVQTTCGCGESFGF